MEKTLAGSRGAALAAQRDWRYQGRASTSKASGLLQVRSDPGVQADLVMVPASSQSEWPDRHGTEKVWHHPPLWRTAKVQ